MRINTNTAAMNTYSRLGQANKSKSNSLAKLSSGLRINKAGDDAAGLAISEKMKNQISGMKQASRNAQDGISLIQTAEGALNETHSILNRMRDLTVQASNGTNTEEDKVAIQAELTSLTAEVDRIASDTEFNTQGLMNKTEITEASVKENFDPTVNTNDNMLLAKAINKTNSNSALAGDGNVTNADMATALKNLTSEKLDDVVVEYNSTKAEDITADKTTVEGFSTSTKQEDYKTVADKYGVAGTAGANATDGEIATLNDAIAKAETTTLSKSDLGETRDTEFNFQIGANAGEKISVEIKNMSTKGLGISDIDVTSNKQTTDEILGDLDKAIADVSTQRANLGAVQNRLDHTVSNLSTTRENLNEANSRIRDVDMAEEMMDFTKSNILSQASTAMLAQANQMPQGVLQLLG